MDIGCARVSTAKQYLARQLDALAASGIKNDHIFVDNNPEPPPPAPELYEALTHPLDRDVLIVHTLDRLGRTVRDTLNTVYDPQRARRGCPDAG